ncbi:MAG: hypothetical protein ABSB88_00295 [Bryobacteraceae bacterium]|jgi:hypothetical protein
MEVRRRSVTNRTLPALLILFASVLPAANPFPKVGEINLNDRLAALGEPRLDYMSVWAVAFSPDGSRLAIEFGEPNEFLEFGRPITHRYLLVAPVGSPETAVYWTNIAKLGFPGHPPFFDLEWAPDGSTLAFGMVLIGVPGGETCRNRGGFLGFLSPTSGLITVPYPAAVIAAMPGYGSPGAYIGPAALAPTIFGVIDSQCHLQEEWITDQPLRVDAISPDGDLLALAARNLNIAAIENRRPDLGVAELILVRPAATDLSTPTDPLQTLGHPLPEDGVPRKQLAIESGKKIRVKQRLVGSAIFLDGAVCGLFEQGPYRGGRNVQMLCWNTETGKQVRQSRPIWSRSVLPLSAGGGRVAVGDSGQLSSGDSKAIPRRYAIWDFKSRKIIAEWSPELGKTMGAELGAQLGLAISPDGRLLAEAGSDSVRLYRLP